MKVKLSVFMVLLVAALLASRSANAVSVMGYITSGCGEWVAARHEPLGTRRAAFEATLLAYLSGYASGTGSDFLPGNDWKSIALWVDNYCNKNPLEKLGDAADELAAELIRRKGRK